MKESQGRNLRQELKQKAVEKQPAVLDTQGLLPSLELFTVGWVL